MWIFITLYRLHKCIGSPFKILYFMRFSTFILVADNFITVFLSTLSTLSTFYCGNLPQQNTLFSFEKGCAIIQLFQSAVVLTAYNRNFLRK